MQATFIADDGALTNVEHAHLQQAHIGVLWTNVPNGRHMRAILGQAEMPMARGGKWAIARHDQQIRAWFGAVPDFLITLDAPFMADADDPSVCALVEHGLLHCAQARDVYGAPRFTKDGRPIFALRGHDVEQFTAIVERYGSDATGASEFVRAANAGPTIATARIAGACGTIARAAA
jgi:hypothetical protein